MMRASVDMEEGGRNERNVIDYLINEIYYYIMFVVY